MYHSLTDSRAIRLILSKTEAGCIPPDQWFDALLPMEAYDSADIHWTHAEVIQQALQMLKPDTNTKLLDVGSGCGKFCLIFSLASQASCTGVELRGWLVELANKLKTDLGARLCSFVHGDMQDMDWSPYNTFYFYNPFYEFLMEENNDDRHRIDADLASDSSLFYRYRKIVFQKLADTAIGTRVLTYHGMGGPLPNQFVRIQSAKVHTGVMELWKKML